MKAIFKLLVAGSTILFVILWLFPFFGYELLSHEELRLLALDGYRSMLPAIAEVYWGSFVLWIGVSVGLFFFIRIARPLFMALLVISVVFSPFWGYRVATPYEVFLGSLVTLCDGAIIAMAYLTTIREQFIGKIDPH